MPLGSLYVTAFSLGAALCIAGFWTWVLARGLLPTLLPQRGAIDHVVAEFLAAALLVAGAIGMIVDHQARWSRSLAALGLGATAYALAGSRGLYPREQRALRAAFLIGWLFLIPAVVALLVA